MKVYRIHSLTLKNVRLNIQPTACFMHDYELLGVTHDDVRDELEGCVMYIYTGDFTGKLRATKCPWCDEKPDDLVRHAAVTHGKTDINIKMFKFQQEMYRERLVLLRSGVIDHTYFVYLNKICQFCDDETRRGRGLCAIPESARNKTRSLLLMGFEADSFPQSFLAKPNLGYIVGQPL